jgi:glycolate oxidase FAD binding subunit
VGLRSNELFASVVGAAAVSVAGEQVVVRPANAQQVAESLRICTSEGLTVTPVGGATCANSLLASARTAVVLDMTGLNQIEQYDPGDLTLRVQAGVTVSEVQSTLAANGQMLPLDIADADRATIGGVLATAAHGPMRASFGGPREYCIGIEFALAEGTLAKAGGMVVKNVAGYDLMKLLIGSYGTLGVITSANFKVFPRPAQTATFSARFTDSRRACEFILAIRRSPLAPLRLELIAPGTISGDVEGGGWRVLLQAAGSERVVERYRRDMSALCTDLREIEAEQASAIWDRVVHAVPECRTRFADAAILEVMVPLGSVASACDQIVRTALARGFRMSVHGRGGIGHLIAMCTPESALDVDAYVTFVEYVREKLPSGSHVTVLFAPPQLRGRITPAQIAPDALDVMRTIRSTLNPHNLLSPGALFA